jgi:RNA polymerase sigma-70 factor (ECF subfamily)
MKLPEGYATEAELLEALNAPARREHAYRALIRAWQRPLYGHVHRLMGNHDDTSDVLQDAFAKFVRSLHTFRSESALSSWLFAIASRTALDALRKRQRNHRVVSEWPTAGPSAAGESDHGTVFEAEDPAAHHPDWGHVAWDEGDAVHRIQQAVASLPDRQRAVFVLKYFEGMAYRELSEMMGVTEGTLKTLYHHANEKLRRSLSTPLTHKMGTSHSTSTPPQRLNEHER